MLYLKSSLHAMQVRCRTKEVQNKLAINPHIIDDI